MRQQRLHLTPDFRVVAARRIQIGSPFLRAERHRGVVDLADALPAGRGHPSASGFVRSSSRSSHAFASFQSRITVAGEIVQDARNLLDRQSRKKAHHHDLTLPLIDACELIQGIVQRQEVVAPADVDDQRFIERDALATAASLLIVARTREVHQDPAHQASRHRQEVRAVLPADAFDVHEPQIDLVHQRGGLKRVAEPLARHASGGDLTQLRVDQRDQLVERRQVPIAPGEEQLRDALCHRVGAASVAQARFPPSASSHAPFPPIGGNRR